MKSKPKRTLPAGRVLQSFKPATLGFLFTSFTALGQVAPSTPPTNSATQTSSVTPATSVPEAAIELSRFEVNASKDVGYTASETLAGNRLRTDIRDVGSAISIYTAKFLEDTGSLRAQDLLVYTTSAEIGGIRGNFSAAQNKGGFFDDTGAGSYVAPTGNTRVRGLSAADTTRGFFLTDMQFDSYNTERVDIQRGANSILFGLASPGGVINTGLNQAKFKNGGSVSVRTDQYGTFRSSLDYNQVLIPKQLAVRMDLLNDETKYEQKEAWRHDRRIYGAVRYEPEFLNRGSMTTSLRANYEGGQISGVDPVPLPPRDQLSSWWTVANKARNVPTGTYDTVLGKWVGYTNTALGYNDAGSYQVDAAGNVVQTGRSVWIGSPGRFPSALGAVWINPNSTVQGGGGVYAWTQTNARPNLPGENGANYRDFIGIAGTGAILGRLNQQVGFWKDPTLTDTTIFDFYHHTLSGPNRTNGQNFHAINLSLAQTYLDNQLGFEVAYDYQRVDAKQDNAFTWQDGNSINIDINLTLPDGTPNPNFGRPFVASDYLDNYLDFRKRSAARATAFYALDFKKFMGESRLASIFGKHTFTGMWSNQNDDHKSLRYSSSTLGTDYMAAVNRLGNRAEPAGMHYLGTSLANASSPSGAHISGVTVKQLPASGYTALFYNPNTHAFVNDRPITVVNDPYEGTFGASWSKQKVDSRALVWQGHLLDNVIVPTIGWRHDRARAYQAVNPPKNLATGYAIINDPAKWYLKSVPTNEISGNNTSYSVVAHTPRFIKEKLPYGMEVDLSYNKSENFSPSAGGENVYGRPMPPSAGSTKDYGITVSFFQNRLQFKALKYEATAQNAQSGDVNTFWVIQTEVNYWNASRDPYNVINNPAAVAAYRAKEIPDSLKAAWNWTETVNTSGNTTATASRTAGYNSDLTDTTSKGYEFEIHAVPLTGWNVSFNASKTEAVQANNLKDLLVYMTDRIGVYTGTAGQMVTNPSATTTIQQDAQNNLIIPYMTGLAKNGMAQQELHRWRWNLVTNYTFRQGALKGFSIGGAVRWQDAVAIGYGLKRAPAGNLLYDLDKPYKGSALTNYDLWFGYERSLNQRVKWKVQLNAKDIFHGNDLVPVAAQPNGSIAVSRIAPETLYSLTNTFSF